MTKYMAEEMVGTSSRPIDTVSGKMCRGGLPIRVIITVVQRLVSGLVRSVQSPQGRGLPQQH